MASDLLPKLRFGDDFIVKEDVAIFARPFSFCKLQAKSFPVILFPILAEAPDFEVPLVLCFAR